MLSGQNDVVSWVDDTDHDDAVSYPQPHPHPHAVSHFPLDCHDWYLTAGNLIHNPLPLLPPPPHHHQTTSFFPSFVNPFDPSTSFNFPPDSNFLGPGPDPGPQMDFGGGMGFESFDPSPAPKMLMPLEIGSVGLGPGARSTLFEKRVLGKRKRVDVNGEESEGEEEGSYGGKMVNYYDSENEENNGGGGGELNYCNYEGNENWSNSNANSGVTGEVNNNNNNINNKGKRKGGMPAKNLMAERRRRKKLNDRLYMLRSVVPKISKVDAFCYDDVIYRVSC